MTAPEARTAVETEEILSTWLEHGDLSIVARRLSAPVRYRGKRDRHDKDSPWVVAMTLSAEERMPTGQVLGKAVGQ
jgi:hypothetical protein